MRLFVMALSFCAALAALASPLFQKIFVDRLLNGTSTPDPAVARLGWQWIGEAAPLNLILIAAACGLAGQALNLFATYTSFSEGVRLQRSFGERLYRKMLSIRSDAISGTTVGEVVSIFATDVPGSTALIDQALPMGGGILFPLIFAPIAIEWIVGIPLWSTLLVMACMVCLNVVLSIRQAHYFFMFKQLAAERTGIVNEWVQNIRLLRILGWMEQFERKIFNKREEETVNRVKMVTNGQMMGSFGSSVSYVINLTAVASLVYLRGKPVTPGELFALLWILGVFLTRPFRQIPWILTFSFDSLTSIRRLERFLSRPSDVEPMLFESDDSEVKCEALALRVRKLNLQINGTHLLHDIDLQIVPGEFVAIVGEVGSGKSLLLLSLMGETGATFQEFVIGAHEVQDWSLNDRRKRFGFVSQDGFVMSSSLRDNIGFRYDVPAEQDVAIRNSLELAQFDVATESLSDGLDTEIGERGVNLSGGQRQRVSMARAHFFSRPILLLDDCLSAVDVDTEGQLIKSLLKGAWRDQTRLLVTHRLSILPLVDRVLFIENGRIIANGPFEELLASSPRVRSFVASVRRAEASEEVLQGTSRAET